MHSKSTLIDVIQAYTQLNISNIAGIKSFLIFLGSVSGPLTSNALKLSINFLITHFNKFNRMLNNF